MELTVLERLMLLNVLPQEGNFTTLKIVRKLREDLSFSEEEHRVLNLQNDDGRITWNLEADSPKEIEIGAKAHEVICERLKDLDKKKQLTMQHYDLYERFVVDPED